jgi:hypothetical protein
MRRSGESRSNSRAHHCARLKRHGLPFLRAVVSGKTFKRDYVDGGELGDAEPVHAQLSASIEHYNTRAPHSALGMRRPTDYRAALTPSPRGEQNFGEHSSTRSAARVSAAER